MQIIRKMILKFKTVYSYLKIAREQALWSRMRRKESGKRKEGEGEKAFLSPLGPFRFSSLADLFRPATGLGACSQANLKKEKTTATYI